MIQEFIAPVNEIDDGLVSKPLQCSSAEHLSRRNFHMGDENWFPRAANYEHRSLERENIPDGRA
jgi:hypothetical protein